MRSRAAISTQPCSMPCGSAARYELTGGEGPVWSRNQVSARDPCAPLEIGRDFSGRAPRVSATSDFVAHRRGSRERLRSGRPSSGLAHGDRSCVGFSISYCADGLILLYCIFQLPQRRKKKIRFGGGFLHL